MDNNSRKQRGKKNDPQVILPTPCAVTELPEDYFGALAELKQLIYKTRLQAVQTANTQLIMLYWQMGTQVLQRQRHADWGAKVIDRLSHDLKTAFPDMQGFSPRNLKYMRKFAKSWPDAEFVQQTVAQIPWGSNLLLLEKLETQQERLWYASQALQHGWSRNVLNIYIESKLHLRHGKSQNNFPQTLPPKQSDMAIQIFKDPYLFDFLGTDAPRREVKFEARLLEHLQHFLLELGQGFAFVGRQIHLEVADEDYYADLLFYHLKLRCYVVVELKMGKFNPGFVSQLNMYQTIIDEQLRHPDDNQTIGLLLVKEKNQLIVEYALAGYNKPIGVAEWQQQLTKNLPDTLQDSLPTIEQIEKELGYEE